VKSPDGKAIYVMDQSGNMYVIENPSNGTLHHSSLAGGQQPVAAGHIAQIPGEPPHNINNDSGHYKPDESQADLAKQELANQGVNTSNMGGIGMK
jgi:hypothetical protein